MKKEKKFQGVVIPAVTPLTGNLNIDRNAVERIFANFRIHHSSPFILGTTGESASLPLNVKTEYIETAGKLKQPGEFLYAGISSNCLQESLDLAKHCADNAVDAVAVTLPGYYALSEDQMRKYFETVADRSPLPVIIYNIPGTVHMSVPVSLIEGLSYHQNIAGVKDSERSDERLKESLNLWADRDDFSYFLGWAARSAQALSLGADGLIPSTGNLYPGLYDEMYKALKAGEKELMFLLQKHSDLLGDIYQGGRLLGESLWALKYLMQLHGLCEAIVMPPLQPLASGQHDILRKKLDDFKVSEGKDFNYIR